MTKDKIELIYLLTVRYGSEYRTSKESTPFLQMMQRRMLLESGYCFEGEEGCIDCDIPYLDGGEFTWRLMSHDNIVSAVKTLYDHRYSIYAEEIFQLRKDRAERFKGVKLKRRERRNKRIRNVGSGGRRPSAGRKYRIVDRGRLVSTIEWI